jgi:hypothetical protein
VTYTRYNTTEHLTGTMFEFGRYTLSYQPPEGAVEADVNMSISSEADLTEMIQFFETFLQASGYLLEDRELTLVHKESEFDTGGFSVTPVNNYAFCYAGMPGGMGDDVIKF